jgi:hypothetical protein
MKKQLLTVLGLAVLATPAFASKARLQALGEDIYGSAYISDNRNIFLNAANVHNYKNMVTMEWGNSSNITDNISTAANPDGSNNGPKAEGGVILSAGNYVYGVYLGDEANDSSLMRVAGGLAPVAAKEENNIGLFFGGENGVKWGASLVHSKSENDDATTALQSAKQEAMRARIGAFINSNLETFASVNITNKAENGDGTGEFKGKLGYRVGAIYNLNDWRAFGTWTKLVGNNEVTDKEQSLSVIEIGAGRSEKINDKFTLFTKASVVMLNTENESKTVGFGDATCSGTIAAAGAAASVVACKEYTRNSLPVVIGMEYSAASWLTLRGSVGQSVYAVEEDKDDSRTVSSSTNLAAGASLLFGDMTIDGVVGNNPDGATPGNNGTSTGAGQLRTDSLMSRVSMTYKF